MKKVLDILFIFFIYVCTTILSVKFFNFISCNTDFSLYVNVLLADIFATIIIFICSCFTKNASVYDPYWSVQPIIILGCFLLAQKCEYSIVPSAFAIFLYCIICFWGIRLTVNWAYTFKDLSEQDWRYTMLKEKTGKFYPVVNFFGIHLVPTLIVYGCLLPALYVCVNNSIVLNIWSIIFGCISIFAVILQGTADYQMHKYRKNKAFNPDVTQNQFIRTGLWKYSRHTNYLGEILMWWGIALAVVFAFPRCWFLVAGAFVNNCLFLFISIPMADKRQSKKIGFDEYKKQTRMLLPIKK